MKNGFVLPASDFIVRCLLSVNIVEYTKNLAAWFYKKRRGRKLTVDETITAKNFGIDLFMVAKWAVVIWFIVCGVTGLFALAIVYYLVASNLFTYFYYHVWGSPFQVRIDIDSQRRRFQNFVLSIAFYVVCYAYLYQFQFADQIQWPEDAIDTTNAIYLSIANAFTLTYGGFAPLSQSARVLFMTELINTFFFFTIIVANAIPSLSSKD